MKQVIFVCLLSLSMCLSLPNNASEPTSLAPPTNQLNVTATEIKTNAAKEPEHPAETTIEGAAKPTTVIAGTPKTTAANSTGTQTPKIPNETSTKTNSNKTADNTNSTTVKPADTTVKPDVQEKGENKTSTVLPATNGTKADGKEPKKNEVTTPKAENVSPTAAPVEAKSRAFDGPSFIGGIILTLGMLAIGFMGFKYYKNQTERNYHTL